MYNEKGKCLKNIDQVDFAEFSPYLIYICLPLLFSKSQGFRS